jgi:hypothetical protein
VRVVPALIEIVHNEDDQFDQDRLDRTVARAASMRTSVCLSFSTVRSKSRQPDSGASKVPPCCTIRYNTSAIRRHTGGDRKVQQGKE